MPKSSSGITELRSRGRGSPPDNFGQVSLTHPHDYYRLKQLTVQPSTCFVLMPFARAFNVVFETIETTLRGVMVCTRADDLTIGDSILERVMRGIGTADLIIADLTGRNANVFYELGIAHTRTKNVLLLAQDKTDVPFDLQNLCFHLYDPTTDAGLQKLREVVLIAAQSIVAKRMPGTAEGASTRTRLILDHLRGYGAPRRRCDGLVIRIQAGVSSLGNLPPGSMHNEDAEYTKMLDEERAELIQLARVGAMLHVILSPRRVALGEHDDEVIWNKRLDRVLEFLESSDAAPPCEVVLSPTIGPNLLFFGERVLFEGHKTGISRGFGCTMVFTERSVISPRLRIFDQLFDAARADTLAKYGGHGAELRDAVIRGVREAKVRSAL